MRPSKQKSRTFRRVFVRTPGAKVKVHYKKRKPKIVRCAVCKKPLQGIPRLSKTKFKNLPKTKKRPQRPYGGYLCSKCSRKEIINKIKK
jgi:large subunit ribosomal protein L34e